MSSDTVEPNKKVDRRVQRTRQELHQALQQLILEKRYDKITVQDIIDRADVGRSTFYAHFLDKADLLEQGLRLYGDQFHEQAAHSHDDGHVVHSLVFFHHAHSNRDLYRAMIDGGGGDFLLETGRRHIIADIQRHLDEKYPDGLEMDVLMSVLTWWLDEDMPCSPERVNEMYQQLATPGVQTLS